jgi:hypothetical protein
MKQFSSVPFRSVQFRSDLMLQPQEVTSFEKKIQYKKTNRISNKIKIIKQK